MINYTEKEILEILKDEQKTDEFFETCKSQIGKSKRYLTKDMSGGRYVDERNLVLGDFQLNQIWKKYNKKLGEGIDLTIALVHFAVDMLRQGCWCDTHSFCNLTDF